MAKKQKKAEKSEAAEAPSALPQLSDDTLSALTSKIESKLLAPKPSKGDKKPPPKPTPAKATPKTDTSNSTEKARGQKRNASGDVVQNGKQSAKTGSSPGKKDNLEALRAEIIALGGTEEDLALVAELESDSEVEGDAPSQPQKTKKSVSGKKDNLQNDVAKMLTEMGMENSRANATTADSDEDMEDDVIEEPPKKIARKEAKVVDAESPEPDFAEDYQPPVAKRGSSRLTVTAQADWYAISLPELKINESTEFVPPHVINQLHQYAKDLLQAENDAYQADQKSGSSSQKFYSQIITSGTLTDKISALTLAVQESPVHNVKGLENLLGLARKRSRTQAIDVLRALKDLFAQGQLLPSDRRLRTFGTQPALLTALEGVKTWTSGESLPKPLRPQHLILWAYEHWLKDVYFEVIKILENWCNDELEFSKARALTFVYELLKEKPEQESNLLRLLVNKLGDRTKKIASRSSYLMLQLELAHPLMKGTIISAVENELLWRPGQTLHAKYYAVVTLNQTVLSSKEEQVASKLLDIYFGLFVSLLKPQAPVERRPKPSKDGMKSQEEEFKAARKLEAGKINIQEGELREKLTSAILTGINRAYPYVLAERERVAKHMDTLFKITHSANFNTSIQAMLLIQQLTVANQMASDRFYRTLYESLLDPRLMTSSKQSLYLNLLFKSLKADLNVKRVKAFVKRILQIISLHQPSFLVGCLHLLKELEVTFPSLKALIDEPEEHDLDEENFRDVDEDAEAEAPAISAKTNQEVIYDSKKRDPEHSNADRSCLWEVMPYLAHYHPSVSVAAESVLHHTKLSGKPDLTLYTLIHFLDRFVYRNAKAAPSSTLRGSSIMQPTLAGDVSGSLFTTTSGQQQLPVNTEKFWRKKAEDVAAEDAFFHQYFASIGKAKVASKKKTKVPTEDEEEEDAENAIWKAITESNPELEGADESDDLDMADLESDFEESDDEDIGELEDEMDELSDAASDDEGFGGVELVGFDDAEDDDAGMDLDDEDEEEASATGTAKPAKTSKKDKNGETTRERKKRLKAMPTFASAADYAKMLEDDEGEDMG